MQSNIDGRFTGPASLIIDERRACFRQRAAEVRPTDERKRLADPAANTGHARQFEARRRGRHHENVTSRTRLGLEPIETWTDRRARPRSDSTTQQAGSARSAPCGQGRNILYRRGRASSASKPPSGPASGRPDRNCEMHDRSQLAMARYSCSCQCHASAMMVSSCVRHGRQPRICRAFSAVAIRHAGSPARC